ncbi:MAG: hypothetical protein GF310_08490 [candidate division Zixibacteria bacterium]|nr:hypothetical protein [candidate division Zixibacteria bacterium]
MPESEERQKLYICRDGDWMGKIAKDFNHADPTTVYDHDKNSYLREKRPEKNLMARGDEVWVPVLPTPEFPTKGKNDGPVDISVTLAVREQITTRLKNTEGESLTNLDYTLRHPEQDEEVSASTGGEGQVDQELPPGVEYMTVELEEKVMTWNMGYMDPPRTVSGYANRLKNLGYFNHDIPEKKNMELYRALRRFQQDNDLSPTGNADTPTIDKLIELHGC